MRFVSFSLSIAVLGSALCQSLSGQAIPQEKANEARIDKLLGQMTLEEKVNLIRGETEPAASNQGQAGYLPGASRLGIPSLRFADGPPGLLTRVAGQAETATMGVAATFSLKDARDNGVVIGREARSLGIDVALQPFINIDRDLTFARGYNTFGEDPLLTGLMGAAEIRGIQSQDVMAQAKHYVGYDSDSYSVAIDPQTLHEVYLAPFAQAVGAGVSSVMCSYNRINGPFACGNAETLKVILKGELGFRGFVTSDWGAVHSATFINDGLDMEMPGLLAPGGPFAAFMHTFFRTQPEPKSNAPKFDPNQLAGMLGGTIPEEPPVAPMNLNGFPRDNDGTTLRQLLANGTVTAATITAAARRVLYEIDRFGYLDGRQKHTVTAQDIDANAAAIERTAEDAAVLLKNDGNLLPLSAGDLGSLAMIGPTAGQVAAIGAFGERSPGLTERQVGPLAAMRRLAPSAHIAFAVADDMTGAPVPAEDFMQNGKPGLQRFEGAKAVATDRTLNFTRANGNPLPANTTASWKGQIVAPHDGDYWMYLQVLGARGVLKIDGREVGRSGATEGAVHGDVQHATQDNGLPTTDGLDNVRRSVTLTRGAHAIEVSISPDTSNAPAQVRLNWMTPEARRAAHDAAIEAAKAAKIAVVFAWTRGHPAFGLPGGQDKLIEEIAAVNPNTIVVLNTSQPVALPWIGRVKAVLEMWWPGDEGGWATAKVLLGRADPAGRLPVTWGRRLEDYPATDPAHPERSAKGVDGKTTYSEGVLIGYRWFDAEKEQPLFPFGFGLSYTQFRYSDVSASRDADGGVLLRVRVTNTGGRAGDDVPQAYLDAPAARPPGVQFAPRILAAFDRVTLAPGASRMVDLHLARRQFEYWSVRENKWVLAAGDRRIQVGGNSRDLPASAVAHVQ
jgi:beta-glucosidase